MKKPILATRRRWDWKVFLVLVALTIPAAFAILPYLINFQDVYSESANTSPGWGILLLDRLINIPLLVLLGGIGLLLANRIGLGMPFVEAWVNRESALYRFHNIVAIAWIAAVVLVLLDMFLHTIVLDAPLDAMLENLHITVPEGAHTPPLYGLLAAFSAGITEEILYRLFGLSLLAWLGGLLFHDSEERPKPIVFWIANVLFALGFGVAHLPKVVAMGWPINAFVVTYVFVFNGIGGLAFGWLFWTYGLESAMLAHFFADVVMYTLLPIIDMQDGEIARYLAIAGVTAAILMTFVWACQSLILESRRDRAQTIT